MESMSRNPEWREFEEAVAAFVAALDKSARVIHNLRLPDRHHRRKRQRDVWIEAKVCGHFPVSILVSCKRSGRRLHSGDIDAFSGELASSQARLGVLYSYSGFSKPAIEKARVLGIPCCRLYADQPPDLPEVLQFVSYCCSPQVGVSLKKWPAIGWHCKTWRELFELPVSSPGGQLTLLSELASRFHAAEAEAVQAVRSSVAIPQPFAAAVRLTAPAPDAEVLEVQIVGQWKFYQARLEAYRINGSYEITSGDFKGQIATPAIDRLSTDPGPGWERIPEPPTSLRDTALIILYKGNFEEALMAAMGRKALASGVEDAL